MKYRINSYTRIASRALIPLFVLVLQVKLYGQEFKDIKFINDHIICVYITDGHINHPGLGQIPWQDGTAEITPPDLAKLKSERSYLLQSDTDRNYRRKQKPVKVGLKSKGVDFMDQEIPGAKLNHIVRGYWIYLVLPQKLQNGNHYTLELKNLVTNIQTIDFVYDTGTQLSKAVHVNQIGYSTNSRLKYGYVYHWMGDLGPMILEKNEDIPFYLVRKRDNTKVYSGKIQLRRKLDNPVSTGIHYENDFAMASVYECDFSDFNEDGEYWLEVEGFGRSYSFLIGAQAYREAFYVTTRGLFHHRSGIDRSLEYSEWPKPIEHRPGVNGFTIEYSNVKMMDGGNNFTGLPKHATGEVFPTNKGDWMPENDDDWGWGGYFDAGDWDRHTGHLSASEYLMYAYEMRPENFKDNELRIPESGNGIPDILDEAKFGIDCYRRLQGPTGGICGGMEEDEHPKPGENSLTDSRPWFVYAEDERASFRLAGAATQLAYNLELAGFNHESDSLLRQAIRVYEWALKGPDAHRAKRFQLRAAAWLYKYTGNYYYLNHFHELYNEGTKDDFAFFVYATSPDDYLDQQLRATFVKYFTTLADDLVESGKAHPARLIQSAPSGWSSTNYLINVHKLIFAFHLTGNEEYMDYVYTTCDYNLGNNPINTVYVTGLGKKHVNEIFNYDSWYLGKDKSIPGIVPYNMVTEFVGDFGREAEKNTVWRPYVTYNSCYPQYHDWPTGELWFENRYLINCNEYTISETIGPAAAAYAFVAGPLDNGIDTETSDKIELNQSQIILSQGETRRIGAIGHSTICGNSKITWHLKDPHIASVSATGIIKAMKPGTTILYGKSGNGEISEYCKIEVLCPKTEVKNHGK